MRVSPTGISMMLWASQTELESAKKGGTVLCAKNHKIKGVEFQFSVPLDACEFVGEDGDVRVNLTLVQQALDGAGKLMGEAMGNELNKVFSKLMEAGK